MKKIIQHFHLLILYIFVFVATFAPLLSNDQPLYVSISGHTMFPAFSSSPYLEIPDTNGHIIKIRKDNIDWKNMKADHLIFPIIPYSPNTLDLANGNYASPLSHQVYESEGKMTELPLRFRHLLGTNKLGQDVLAGIMYGTRTALLIGFFSMLIAIFIGTIAGAFAGYFGNTHFKIFLSQGILMILMIVPAWFYSRILTRELFSESIQVPFVMIIKSGFHLLIFILLCCWPAIIRFKKTGRQITLPIDYLVNSAIEIFISLPRLLLILVIAAVMGASTTMLILIIGLTSWTEIARMVRIQVMQIKTKDFIPAAEISGSSIIRIWIKHIFPNALKPVLTVWIYGIAAAVLAETSLSFVGAGLAPDVPSWGKMMFESRENYQAWWAVIFPGLALFLLLYAMHGLMKKSKLKSISMNRGFNKI